MNYKNGDKFIIEIESRINSQGLYKVKGFNTLVFDDYGLDRLEQVHEHDGCKDCKYEDMSSAKYPCSSCGNAYYCLWEPKTEEIQVGDEVVHQDGQRGIVFAKEYDANSCVKMFLKVFKNQKGQYSYWAGRLCHRTGKTYPELIKALEQLPKECGRTMYQDRISQEELDEVFEAGFKAGQMAEAPEIIRCKNCRHNSNCEIQYAAQAGNEFFCGAAERQEDISSVELRQLVRRCKIKTINGWCPIFNKSCIECNNFACKYIQKAYKQGRNEAKYFGYNK